MSVSRQQEEDWNPYVGPRPFRRDLDDQNRFFGRDEETEQILSLIYGHQLVLIYAQSGAGKTSLFNAQVAPELEKNGFQVLPVARVGIGFRNDTESTFKEDVVDTGPSLGSNPYVLNTLQSLMPEFNDRSLNAISIASFLHDYFPHKVNQRGKPVPQVIIFDQLEELFNLYSDPNRWREQQEDFFEQVADAVKNDPLLRVIFIIREDYLAQLDPFVPLLPERLKAHFRLERLDKDAAFEAIKEPLEKGKDFVNDERLITKLFDEGIIDKLIEDLLKIRVETFGGKFREAKGEFVEPIQLQVVCHRLWNKLKTSEVDQINQSYFEYLQDVDKALEAFYVETITETSKQTDTGEDTIRNWFEDNLITSSGTRGIVHRGSNLKTNKIYVASPDSNKLFVIDGNKCNGLESLNVGKNPQAVAVDSKLNKVYVANNDSNNISIIDRSIIDRVPVGRGPDAVAVDLNTSKAYVANSKDNTISVIDGRTDTILGKPIPVGQYPQAIAIDPNTHKVYVANQNNNTVSVIDGLTSTVVGKISVGRGPSFVAIDPKMQKVYVAGKQGKSVSVIDIKTDKVVDRIVVGSGLAGLTVDTKTGKVYVSDSHPNSIYVIDGQNNSVIKTVHLNNTAGLIFFNPITNLMYHLSGNEFSILNPPTNGERDIIPVGMAPIDVEFDQKTKKLYVANMGSALDQPLGTVSVIDLKTNKIVSNIKVGDLIRPDGIAIDPTTNKAYVSNFANNTISVIDLKTNAVIGKPIQVQSEPNGIAIDLNARKAYVPNYDSDTVSVIDLNTNKIVATIYAGVRGPFAVAVNPNTGKVYVANAKGGTLSVIDGRTNTVEREIPVDAGPEAVAVDAIGGKAYVANFLDSTVSVVDLNTYKVKRIYLDDGSSPDAVTIAARNAYISNSKTDSVSVMDLKTDKLVSNIKVGSNPKAVAVDPSAGKAYVANHGDNTVSIIKLYGTSASKLKS